MPFTIEKKTIAAGMALAFMAVAGQAHAGDAHDLKSWTKAAGASVNKVMSYPQLALRKGEQGYANFRVTVNSSGEVVNSDLLQRANSSFINSAAKSVVDRAAFPALPSDFDGEELTFSLQLTYAIAGSAFEERALQREARVTGREIAQGAGPLTASIQILDNQAD